MVPVRTVGPAGAPVGDGGRPQGPEARAPAEPGLLPALRPHPGARSPRSGGRSSATTTRRAADAVEKRFDRDKADLRAIGVNIEYMAGDVFGRAGYVIDPRRYYLRETTLEPEDAMLLAVLQRTLGVVDDALGRNLKSALAKLTIDSQLPEPLRASVGEQHLLTLGPARARPRPHAPPRPGGGPRPAQARPVPLPHRGRQPGGEAHSASLRAGPRRRELAPRRASTRGAGTSGTSAWTASRGR